MWHYTHAASLGPSFAREPVAAWPVRIGDSSAKAVVTLRIVLAGNRGIQLWSYQSNTYRKQSSAQHFHHVGLPAVASPSLAMTNYSKWDKFAAGAEGSIREPF